MGVAWVALTRVSRGLLVAGLYLSASACDHPEEGQATFLARSEHKRVVIHFAPGHGNAVRSALAAVGGSVHHDFDRLGAVAVTVPENALTGLAHNPNVLSIEDDARRAPMGEGDAQLLG